MVKIYVRKIKNGEINPSTGMPWSLDDVPQRWYEAVKAELEK